tara:strand:+ start:2933 stop:5161 length:2229 start_codon:yes stop_codon:yes gene_type:complete
MSGLSEKIIYTKTDEAPFLATHSLLPIFRSFSSKAGIEIESKDISLASRVLAEFPEYLEDNQRVNDELLELGKLVKMPQANIIKLPNISASIPQLIATIKELQFKGYKVPSYPETPNSDEEIEIKNRYDKVKGSAVNPVLREGNSDRRAPGAVKNYAKLNPHKMGDWSINSKSHVATMNTGDFFHNEQSICVEDDTDLKVMLFGEDGSKSILKQNIRILGKEIIDATVMSKKELISFLEKEIKDAKDQGVLLSLHMKATMMKVSDPIIFGYVVEVFFSELINKHQKLFNELGVDFRNGFGNLTDKLPNLSNEKRLELEMDIETVLQNNAELAMVDSDKGITNLHVPSDVIIDASMPAMIRNSGKMWNKDADTKDTKAIIPDSSYASIYSATIEFCKKNGAFNPETMGTVPNVGLMAQKAEEYGSHDKTYEILSNGIVKVIDSSGKVLLQHDVEKGDIWRMCQTKDEPIRDWVKLAVKRTESTGWPAIFWLDAKRAHDAELIKKVRLFLDDYTNTGLDIRIMAPYEATIFTLERIKRGENTISVTGNVLRDYLTDLFPILELGTSAKMLSIVPLMNGGGLFETGAGGSAPKHVQQLLVEGHFRWDSLGEFLALVVSLEHFSETNNNLKAQILADTLDSAITNLLKNGRSPQRTVGKLDNRGSHYYLAMYWARELANQNSDVDLQITFEAVALKLESEEEKILNELDAAQGKREDIKGYYFPDRDAILSVMRPSMTFNSIIDNI